MTAGTAWLPAWLRGAWEVPGVTDVLVNGPDEIWIDRGLGLEKWVSPSVREGGVVTAGEVREAAVRLASLGGRRLDDACPVVDARLPDGSRLHAVLPPVSQGSAVLSLRAVRAQALTLDDLVLAGTVAPDLAPVLAGLVGAHASILVTGATGAGKTTLLATLLGLVDPRERIVVIEEAGEVSPDHPHVVRLIERRANVDGAGAVGLGQLVREALRMRPDRIVLGECRGAEVREVMLALNTGHRGGFATLHANSVRDVPSRLVALAALARMGERAAAMHAQAAFQAVVHVRREAGRRWVAEVGVFTRAGRDLEVDLAASVTSAGEISWGAAGDLLRSLAAVAEVAA
jgi:pilus assembly protein CpaF